MAATLPTTTPVVFVSHGGGPLFVLGEAAFGPLPPGTDAAGEAKILGEMAQKHWPTAAVKSILVISAHWESDAGDTVRILRPKSRGQLLYE